MTINSLNIYCNEIARTKDTRYLFGIRAQLQGMLKAGSITIGMYQGLNKDIRDRADWLKSRGNK